MNAVRAAIGTIVIVPTLMISIFPAAISSYIFDRPMPVRRQASGILTQMGGVGATGAARLLPSSLGITIAHGRASASRHRGASRAAVLPSP